jgi:hypothetical protein
VDRWARKFDSPAPHGGLSLRAPASACVQNTSAPSVFFDVEGWIRRWRKTDQTLPQAGKAEEEFDIFGAENRFDALHGALRAGTLEGIGSPDAEDEVPPEWAHGAGGGFGWGEDEEDFRLGFLHGFLRRRLDEGGGGTGDAAGFVGVEAVAANGLLAFGRDVFDGGGEEAGGFEDFEVAFGVPTASGALDDGFGVGVPRDFLEGEGGAEQVFHEASASLGVVGGQRVFKGAGAGQFRRGTKIWSPFCSNGLLEPSS